MPDATYACVRVENNGTMQRFTPCRSYAMLMLLCAYQEIQTPVTIVPTDTHVTVPHFGRQKHMSPNPSG